MNSNQQSKYEKPRKNSNKIAIVSLFVVVILLFLSVLGYSWNNRTNVEINILDTNSSISKEIDAFIESNLENPGVHTLKNGEYNYVLIVSEKAKATEMSVNLYDVYKYKFKINIEYDIEINEDTISESNSEKHQTMLIRFKESGEINPIRVSGKE